MILGHSISIERGAATGNREARGGRGPARISVSWLVSRPVTVAGGREENVDSNRGSLYSKGLEHRYITTHKTIFEPSRTVERHLRLKQDRIAERNEQANEN